MRLAEYFNKLPDNVVQCLLCPRECRIMPGKRGECRVRENRNGELTALNYGLCTSWGMDPIEKKPLYHFFPGTQILSVGTKGCNFHCDFCQNWAIAHDEPKMIDLAPERLVEAARQAGGNGCIGIAYTYSEPLVWFEFVLEAAALAHREGLKNVLVTNGFIHQEPLKKLLPFIDALNIDVKGFSEEFYRKYVHGSWQPVLRTAETSYQWGCHVEITTLLIPGLNDGRDEIAALVGWLAGSLGPKVPLHFSRYYPNYKLNLPPTSAETMRKALELAREKMHYVYLGNVAEADSSDTLCPQCGHLLIHRHYYTVEITGLDGMLCIRCGARQNIVR
ncbi:MAG: AmmeMemoRadiSam system radical SAM enzyme [Bacillota bacterium]